MSLRDELGPIQRNGIDCSVRTFVESQADPAEWIEILDDPSIQHSQIWRLMKRHGFALTTNPVTRHRRGQCSCGRATD